MPFYPGTPEWMKKGFLSKYTFSCSDHNINILATNEDLARAKLQSILNMGSEELYSINDYKLEECSNLF